MSRGTIDQWLDRLAPPVSLTLRLTCAYPEFCAQLRSHTVPPPWYERAVFRYLRPDCGETSFTLCASHSLRALSSVQFTGTLRADGRTISGWFHLTKAARVYIYGWAALYVAVLALGTIRVPRADLASFYSIATGLFLLPTGAIVLGARRKQHPDRLWFLRALAAAGAEPAG